MARQSSIQRLDPKVRDTIETLRRDHGRTIDEILSHLRRMLPVEAEKVSRSALGRYTKEIDQQIESFRAKRMLAVAMGRTFEDIADSTTARGITEMLHALISEALGSMERNGTATAADIMKLASSMQMTTATIAKNMEIVADIERRAIERAANAAAKEAKELGLSAARADEMRHRLLRIKSNPQSRNAA